MKRLFGIRSGLIFVVLSALFLSGCAEERPLRDIIPNGKRVSKRDLQGTFLYLRALSEVKYASQESGDLLAPGIYLDSDKLVQFRITETTLDLLSIDPLYRSDSPAETNNVLLSFPVRHVDVLRKQNSDGQDTHEVEETETRRVWKEREYVVIDLTRNLVDPFKNVQTATASDAIELVGDGNGTRSIFFGTTKQLQDGAIVGETYSLLRFEPASGYQQRLYPRSLQDRFGFFKSVTYGFDKYGRMTEAEKREYMNRWNTENRVVYYFSEGFPERLKPMVRRVFANWNEAFIVALGNPVLEIRENSGQRTGDLRYNLIVYDDSSLEHGLLGYGPTVTNPRTGEILKGDVFVYGGALRRSIYAERQWAKLTGIKNQRPTLDSLKKQTLSTLSKNQILKQSLAKLGSSQGEWVDRIKGLSRSPLALFERAKQGYLKDSLRCATRMNAEVGENLSEGVASGELTDDQLEEQIFYPLLTHELGHNLGLRHNFMGSADADHYHPSGKSSSVMDYGFLSSLEPMAPGPYDAAAIQVLYGKSEETVKRLLAENFFFCTDENLMDSRYGLCQQFDSGANLSEVALNGMKRYVASYNFNNLKGDKVHFGGDNEQYFNRVLNSLLTLRLSYDHAQAIAATNDPKQLWLLLRRRIEADSKTTNPMEVEIATGMKVSLDPKKIASAVVDAGRAKNTIFGYLKLIITEDQRPEYDEEDILVRELVTRGVLTDKMLGLLVVSLRTPDPLGSGTGISMYDTLHEPVSALYSSILSNTDTQEIPGLTGRITSLRFFNPNLRDLATSLVFDMADANSIESGEVKELLRLERVAGEGDTEVRKKLSTLRQEFRTLLFELETTQSEQRSEELQELIAKKRAEIGLVNFAAFSVRDNLELKSIIDLQPFNVSSASGLLLRDNLGLIEDRLWVIQQMLLATGNAIGNTESGDEKAALEEKRKGLLDLRLVFSRYLETEKSFVERIYRKYSVQ